LSVQDEIFQWVKGREAWQQELFLRAAATPELNQKDIEELASILLGEEAEGAGLASSPAMTCQTPTVPTSRWWFNGSPTCKTSMP
jgi:hypothetical protein